MYRFRCSLDMVNEIDLVHRVNGKPVKVTDFERIDVFARNPEVNKAMSYLKALLDIRKQLVSGIHPRRSVLCQIEPTGYIDDYLKDKILAIPSDEQSVHLFASINEVFEEGSVWIGYRDLIRKHTNDS